jgi:uncharacterized protein (DUF433 family)
MWVCSRVIPQTELRKRSHEAALRCVLFSPRTLGRFDRITWNPDHMNGQPCIRGMRLTVRRVVEAVATFPNREVLLRTYPDLEPADVQQALEFAAANLEDMAS